MEAAEYTISLDVFPPSTAAMLLHLVKTQRREDTISVSTSSMYVHYFITINPLY